MKKEFHQVVFCPSDLVRYVQSPFVSWVEQLCLDLLETKLLKGKPDALLNYLAGKRLAHESDYLALLEQSTCNRVTISSRLNNLDKIQSTLGAMKSGADVIFQECLTSYSAKDSAFKFQKDALLTQQATASNHNNTDGGFDSAKKIHGWLLTKLSLRFVLAHQVFRVTLQDVIVPI